VQFYGLLTSALVRGEWLDSCPGRLILGARVPGRLSIGSLMDPKCYGEQKILLPLPRVSVVQVGAQSQYRRCTVMFRVMFYLQQATRFSLGCSRVRLEAMEFRLR
jgi:hypothetical protein